METKRKNLTNLEQILNVRFEDQNLLKTSVTHRSYLNEHPEFSQENNERLEFLGDAILELLVSEYLYKKFKKSEGEMTNLRAALVNSVTLAGIAKDLKIEDYLFLSKGETNDTGRARASILANTIEAIIGAIYLDQGIVIARNFIEEKVLVLLPEILQKEVIKDSKSRFQEVAQEEFGITPAYKVIKEWGPDHKKQFLVGVYLDKKFASQGKGFSKQEAEEAAAREALKALSSKFQIPNNK